MEAAVRDALLHDMDDLTFHTTKREAVTARVRLWAEWSSAVGFQESPVKVQVCAPTRSRGHVDAEELGLLQTLGLPSAHMLCAFVALRLRTGE